MRSVFKKYHLIKILTVIGMVYALSQPIPGSAQTGLEGTATGALAEAPSAATIRVPEDVTNLQTAIDQVSDGGIIDLAGGTYTAPAGGYQVINLAKSFTIRARPGQVVTLSGGGSRDIFRLMNSSLAQGRPVVFDRLIFSNGYSNTGGIAGGVTLYYAKATFIGCTFQNNIAGQSGAAGGVLAGYNSQIFFIDSIWSNNSAKELGGGLRVGDHSTVYIHNSRFSSNRTNLPGHSPTSAGGAIHLVDSILRVSNSLFENNQAGFAGGAIYSLGTWTSTPSTPNSDVIISNSRFINNQALRDPSVSLSSATEGGAFHVEGQVYARIFRAVFESNGAMAGGALSNYRGRIKINNSVFRGNQAFALNSIGGFGGAIAAGSNDLPSDGNTNRPVAQLEISDSLLQGSYGTTTIAARGGGGIYSNGDIARMYGLNGVSKMGTLAENRTILVIDRTIFSDLDAKENPDSGNGGALFLDLADLTLRDSMIINSDAIGTLNSSGGALAAINQTLANLTNITIARNSASFYGGAIFLQGSELNLTSSTLIANSTKNTSTGSAIYSAPDTGRNLPAKGVVKDSLISENNGLAIFDDDRTNGPINNLRYDNNRFYTPGTTIIYSDSIPTYLSKSVAELNALIVTRQNGTSTDKSQLPNTALTNKPILGVLRSAPAQLLGGQAYLGYAWSGSSATLDGNVLPAGLPGIVATNIPGIHTLSVNGQNFTTSLSQPAVPAASTTFSLDANSFGWNLDAGAFLEAAMDQGFNIPSSPSGTASISAALRKTYNLYLMAEEGGVIVPVDTRLPVIGLPASSDLIVFPGGGNQSYVINICNQGGSELYWTATSSSAILRVDTPSGQARTCDPLTVTVLSAGLAPGMYNATLQIDAGIAGSQVLPVNINLSGGLPKTYLPLIVR